MHTESTRAVIRDNRDGVEIVIPPPRQSPILMVLPLWLCGWLPAGLHSIAALATPGESVSLAFELPWLIVWTLGVFAAAYLLLWTKIGVQRILVTRDELTLSSQILRFAWRRHYAAHAVRNPRALQSTLTLAGTGPIAEPCKIAFDYGARTIQFGAGLADREASRVVAIIRTFSAPSDAEGQNP